MLKFVSRKAAEAPLWEKPPVTFSVISAPFRVLLTKTRLFFPHFRIGTTLAKYPATTSGTRVEVGPEGLLRREIQK